jgi:hypothetical protein
MLVGAEQGASAFLSPRRFAPVGSHLWPLFPAGVECLPLQSILKQDSKQKHLLKIIYNFSTIITHSFF